MKYLVSHELIGTPPASSQEMVQYLEQVIIPSHETYIKLETDKKILAGGALAGRRGAAFIVEAVSNEELSRLLMSLPLWDSQKWDVTPLESFEERQADRRQLLERLKAAQR